MFAAPGKSDGIVALTLIIPYQATTPGLAHYVEHLTWLNALKSQDGSKDPDSAASTDPTVIIYRLSGPADRLTGMLAQLAQVFAPLRLPRATADAERKVLLREYDFRLAEAPDREAPDAVNEFLYAGNAYAVPVLGTPETIGALSYDAAKQFHAATHRPERAMLMASGDVTNESLNTAMVSAGFQVFSGRGADLRVSPALSQTAPSVAEARHAARGHRIR